MSESTVKELLDLTQQLLTSISAGDWPAYERLCDPKLSAFEPEARGHLVEGLEFHRFYLELERRPTPRQTSITAPHVRLLGEDVAVISYIRLMRQVDNSGQPHTTRFEETRVWQRQDGRWKHVHFHRSANT